jgi:hypothetical protein
VAEPPRDQAEKAEEAGAPAIAAPQAAVPGPTSPPREKPAWPRHGGAVPV